MVLIRILLRKMIKNKWLVLCLLLGLILSVALISSIPMYTQGTLQRMLFGDLEANRNKSGVYPGNCQSSLQFDDDEIKDIVQELTDNGKSVLGDKRVTDFFGRKQKLFKEADEYMRNNIPKTAGLPVISSIQSYSLGTKLMNNKDGTYTNYVWLDAVSDLEKHIKIIDGRLPKAASQDGVYEVLVSEWALNKLNIVKDRTFLLSDLGYPEIPAVKVKPVGVFVPDIREEGSYFWSLYGLEQVNRECFFLNSETLKEDFINAETPLINQAKWMYSFDYRGVSIGKLGSVAAAYNNAARRFNGIETTSSLLPVIDTYYQKEARLRNMMWVLNVPVIVMLFLYLFMVSNLVVGREKNEIALLASRGSSRKQIAAIYLAEGLILGGIAFAAGPYLGLIVSKMLGASGGFLEFTRRKALPVEINSSVYLYALLAVAVSIATMMIPAFLASKTSIVLHKRSLSRASEKAVWEKLYLDIILLLASGYGYYTFVQRQHVASSAAISDMQTDPLLFGVSTLFIIGLGLLFLRIYPIFIRFVFWAGRKLWKPSAYIILVQVGRTFRSYQFLVLFLVMTLSTGLFSATTARTINKNDEEKIKYSVGCDMEIRELWQSDAQIGGYSTEGSDTQAQSSLSSSARVHYLEPPFKRYTQLSGVDSAAKVYVNNKTVVETNSRSIENISLMGIDPYEFGKVAWFRNGLLSNHINEYLNLLSGEPGACLISRSISKVCGINAGDSIKIGLDGTDKSEAVIFTVYGIIDYWPSWNPNTDPSKTVKAAPMLVVANLPYIQDHLGLYPYKVWLKLNANATSKQVYDSISEKKISVISVTDAHQQILQLKNNPFRLALNGVLTLGFLISGAICFIGFLIYWILSVHSRVLSFGIFRAIGMSAGKLLGMIAREQVLTSVAGIAAGGLIGLVSSRIFVPFFQIAYDSYTQVPPFKVISYFSDRMKVLILVGFTLTFGLIILGIQISRIKISQAIKLGEE